MDFAGNFLDRQIAFWLIRLVGSTHCDKFPVIFLENGVLFKY